MPNESACRHVATGLNNAVVTKCDTCAGIGSEQAAFPNGHDLLATTGKCAHDRRAAADIRAIADYNARTDPSLHHRGTESSSIKVAEALMEYRCSSSKIGTQSCTTSIGDTDALRHDVVSHAWQFVDATHFQRGGG